MPIKPEQIETIVELVLSRLDRLQLAHSPREKSGSSGENSAESGRAFDGTQQAVITASLLEQVPGHVREIVVGERTRVTPLANDELRRRGIRTRRGNLSSRSRPGPEQIDDPGCVTQLTQQLGQLLPHRQRVLVATDRPQFLVCQLNRHEFIRASIVCGPACLNAAMQQLDPNVLLIDRQRQLDEPLERLIEQVLIRAPNAPGRSSV